MSTAKSRSSTNCRGLGEVTWSRKGREKRVGAYSYSPGQAGTRLAVSRDIRAARERWIP